MEPNESGPLKGLRILEIAGLGPTPVTGMMLADLGADVVLVDRLQPGLKISMSAGTRSRIAASARLPST